MSNVLGNRSDDSAVAAAEASGTVWMNKHADLSPDIPYSGAKQSGLGVGLGLEGIEEFTQLSVINVAK
jgi:acyl-CoA reductase-like NAD-dependent aldehyde dehydrogenase